MIERIVQKYQAVFVFALIVVILGISSYLQLPREEFPEIKRPIIFVTTVYPGVSAKDMENLVTEEIEAEIDGLEGLDNLTSTSSQGISTIVAEFTGNTKVETALRRVRERVDIAKTALPQDAEDPAVRELNFSDQPVLTVVLSNPAGLEAFEPHIDDLKDTYKGIAGVLDVRVSGDLDKELAIEVDPRLLKHYGLSLNDVSQAVQKENTSVPGGVLESRDQEFTLAVSGEIKDPERFKHITVKNDDYKVLLKDIAQVSFTFAKPTTISRVNGKPAVSYSVTKRAGENILKVVAKVKKETKLFSERLPDQTTITYTHDSSLNVQRMVEDLENNIYTGLLFVIAVTLFFLGPINAAFVSLGIPFSMLISFFVLQVFGITLNMVVLFSLILALGMLVDNGIVIVENIYRHRSLGKRRVQAAIDGCKEVAVPISTSTLTTILAFFPIVFMPGIMGEFMQFLPKTVIIVLTSSLLVALTITTVFCSRFLRYDERSASAMRGGGGAFQRLQERYVTSLNWALHRPKTVIFSTMVFVLAGIMLNGVFGKEAVFFPSPDPPASDVILKSPSGTTLAESDRLARLAEKTVAAHPGSVESVQTTVGLAGGRRGGFEASRTHLKVVYVPYLEREVKGRESIETLKKSFEGTVGAEVKVQAQQDGPPSGHDLDYEIIGQDYRVLGEISEQVLAAVRRHSDHLEVIDTDYEAVKPEIMIRVDRERAARYGLSTQAIASTIRTAINGRKISVFREGKHEYDVILRLDDASRDNLAALENLEIVEKGKRIPLSSIAEIDQQSTVGVVKRRERRRAVSVWADFKQGFQDKVLVKQKVDEELASLSLPKGYRIGEGKGRDVRQESAQFLMQAFIVALLLIFMVLVLQFNSVSQPMIILLSVFLSLGGVFWGLLLSGQTFVIIMSGIGIISLAGVVVNNAIVLIDFINKLREQGRSIEEAIVEAGTTRLRPVLLTAFTTVISLLPMGFGVSFDFYNASIQIGSESGEMWAPMAWSIIFGLSLATLLTLIMVPVLVYQDYRITQWVGRVFGRSGSTSSSATGADQALDRGPLKRLSTDGRDHDTD